MQLSHHDSALVVMVLAAAVPVAVLFGVVIARRVHAVEAMVAEQAAERERSRAVESSCRDLVAWVSHDLRTPLAGIQAMAEALQDGVVEDPARHQHGILTEVQRMSGMVDDLLSLSRIHAG
ncbi:MAG: cell wall metabolism sensor histidine kinase WalK [Actinomycetota bacterium]|nr:cell wall metabolism sensor histidine kinase WalK [Actinomycetota bacterium]